MKSSELLALPNLAGYRLAKCYWAQLAHGLMGTFPALIGKTNEMFVCTEKPTLEKVLNYIPRRKFRVTESLMLVNEQGRIAFDLSVLNERAEFGQESESIQVLLAEDLQIMLDIFRVMDPPLFKWAPGLVSDDMSREEFAETMAHAMATGSP